jgi:hypothetical protein
VTDLVPTTSIQLVNPSTGELVELDGPTETLAHFLADMREHESLCKEAKALVNREMLNRLDRQAKWTLYVGDLKLSSPSKEQEEVEEFDGPALHEALYALVDEGLITVEAADAAVETVTSYVPKKAGIKQLRKLGGRVAEVVAEHATKVPKSRYVSVGRA